MKFILKIFLLFTFTASFGQDSLSFLSPSSSLNKKKMAGAVCLQAAGYGGSLAGLSAVWYKNYSHSAFHSFNDNSEWLQMDKAGHFLTSWYLGRMGSDMYEWSGMKKQKAILYGALSGWGYLTGIEILDGFSNGWGFSWGDLSANTLGSGLIIGQKFSHARWFKGLSLKFSFHTTFYPSMRPELLGDSSLAKQMLKDYNGQSYWLSFNLASFMNAETKFPKWLNLACGYGGEGMISGRDEPITLSNGNTLWVERYRKYYFSLDVDLTKIKTRSKFIKTLAETFCFIKIPAPAIEFSKKGVKGYAFYF